jgi:hypothetical protein
MNSNSNQCEFPGEEKVAEGIYITKPKNMSQNNQNNQVVINQKAHEKKSDNINTSDKPSNKYVYKSTAELINLLENDFESIVSQVQMLYEANEEMLKFDPNDYDLIEARQENLEIINKKILRLKEIQEELKKFCPTNPLVLKDVYDYFLQNKIQKNLLDEREISGNVNVEQNYIQTQPTKNSEVITEIEL